MQSNSIAYLRMRTAAREIVRAELEAFHARLEILLGKVSKPDEDQLLTRKFAAAELEVDLSTLWRYTKDGELFPIKRVGRVYYRKSEIMTFKHKLQNYETDHALFI